MPSVLFGDLPLVTSEAELAAVKAENPNLDPYFVASGCCQQRRALFETLWPAFQLYADSNFLEQLSQCGKFHQRAWEMYLCNVLLDKGFSLSEGRNLNPPVPRNEGPDFVVNGSLYIECVTPTAGDANNPDALPAPIISTPETPIFVQIAGDVSHHDKLAALRIQCLSPRENLLTEDRLLLRITQAIQAKVDQHRRWQEKGWFSSATPYIIAVNTSTLEYPGDPQMPYVLKVLFGAHYQCLTYPSSSGGKSSHWQFRASVQRSSGSDVAVNLFASDALRQVNGILFSDNTVLNHLTFPDRECLLVINQFAINPIPPDFASRFSGWNARLDGENIIVEKR